MFDFPGGSSAILFEAHNSPEPPRFGDAVGHAVVLKVWRWPRNWAVAGHRDSPKGLQGLPLISW